MKLFLILEAVLATVCAGIWSALWFRLRREYQRLQVAQRVTMECLTAQKRFLVSTQRELAEQIIINDGLSARVILSEKTNAVLAREIQTAREATKTCEAWCDEIEASFRQPLNKIGLEVFLSKMQASPTYRLPEGVDLLADELGNVLYLPGSKTEYPRRAFVYVCMKGAAKDISRKELYIGQAPDVRHQRVTFVLDEWLTMGEVTVKLRRAAESLLKEAGTDG